MQYRTVIFDCDGVLLDSNLIKENAFFDIALKHFCPEAAAFIRVYHQMQGGVSRYEKFKLLLEKWPSKATLELLLAEFAERINAALLTCPEAKGLRTVLCTLKNRGVHLFVISGADEKELRSIMELRGLSGSFNGIYGSPATKVQIIDRLNIEVSIAMPALFVGDSRTDYEAAQKSGMDFVFSNEFTSLNPEKLGLPPNSVSTLNSLLNLLKIESANN